MALSILTDNTRAKLEEERSRLINERDTIIQAAVTQATVEFDQTLQTLNQLLGDSAPATTESQPAKAPTPLKKAAPAASEKGKTTKQAAIEEKPTEPTSKTAAKGKKQPESKASKSAAPTQPLPLKQEFKSMTPTEAVKQVMGAGKPLTTDDVIQTLYQSVKEANLATARKTIALILGRGTHQGVYEKVGENPSRYQLKA
ncbi:hypothetical protein [Leptolyngbya sp. NIES-2104]|uniref:hypothetical protein n=1 Tax=Leptolyngbya sp. NIES-2104 TaxID=1552121 RepID=UPI0006ECA1A8|nr:hypothetical protein [Leptolyngbya sp. NIES-2104]GAP99729.1 hypothetical protein NIES2104_62950 [Leptolyngbya sp. NIES-2104]